MLLLWLSWGKAFSFAQPPPATSTLPPLPATSRNEQSSPMLLPLSSHFSQPSGIWPLPAAALRRRRWAAALPLPTGPPLCPCAFSLKGPGGSSHAKGGEGSLKSQGPEGHTHPRKEAGRAAVQVAPKMDMLGGHVSPWWGLRIRILLFYVKLKAFCLEPCFPSSIPPENTDLEQYWPPDIRLPNYNMG